MTSDYLIPCEDDFDDIVGAVSNFISGKPRDLKLRQVQAGIYNEGRQTGTLHLLKGSKVQAHFNERVLGPNAGLVIYTGWLVFLFIYLLKY